MADEEEEGPEPVELGNGWYQYEDEEGRHYFYNTITEVTQWEMPAEEELVAEDEEEAYSDCPEEGGEEVQTAADLAALYIQEPTLDTEEAGVNAYFQPADASEEPQHLVDDFAEAEAPEAALLMSTATPEHEEEEEEEEEDEEDDEEEEEEEGGVVEGLGAPGTPSGSQFAEAMAMLRRQGIWGDGAAKPARTPLDKGRGMGVTRMDSQFYQSLNALKSQGVDQQGAATSLPLPKSNVYRQGNPSLTGYVSSDPYVRSAAAAPESPNAYLDGLPTSPEKVWEQPGTEPGPPAPPEEEAAPLSPARAEEDSEGLSAELDGLLATAATGTAAEAEKVAEVAEVAPAEAAEVDSVSNPLWTTVTFQAVVFVWYETNGVSRTEPLFPGADGNLQVGPIVVAWDGLSMHGPAAHDVQTLIPYENIVMWTLHLEETCLDLTLDGTFTIDASGRRTIEWWTGSVLELRCCLSSTESTVNLGNQIKEVCMLKAKETKATNLNKSAIAAAAATLSHQVNTTTPTQRRATLTRKVQPEHAGAAANGGHAAKEKKKKKIPSLFRRA